MLAVTKSANVSVPSIFPPQLRPASALSLSNSCFAFRRSGTGGKSAMEAATRLAWFDANGAGLSLPIASAAQRTISVLKRRTIAGQPDFPHGAAESAYAARGVGARRLPARAEDVSVFAPQAPGFAGDHGVTLRTGLSDALALQGAPFPRAVASRRPQVI
jgi:hypothetical protein